MFRYLVGIDAIDCTWVAHLCFCVGLAVRADGCISRQLSACVCIAVSVHVWESEGGFVCARARYVCVCVSPSWKCVWPLP